MDGLAYLEPVVYPGSSPGVLELDVGVQGGAGRLASLGCGGVIAFAAMAVTGVGAVAAGTSGGSGVVFGVILGALAATFALLLALCVVTGLTIMRFSARLHGTTLEVTRALGSRRVDLARAPRVWTEQQVVRSRENRNVPPIPVLGAHGENGRRVTLPLRSRHGTWLPPNQLVALAGAIESGHRQEPGAAGQAHTVAQALRAVAADPRGPLI